ncbi:mu-type opioid receptor-like [Littorina saxatilis]|uniref:G-protein coupled receptors family 1 profile domain-containing protein n=1 Tax=Littorina saxatilis TaxID=31220 RepID=A0AAN9BY53_9CAEN
MSNAFNISSGRTSFMGNTSYTVTAFSEHTVDPTTTNTTLNSSFIGTASLTSTKNPLNDTIRDDLTAKKYDTVYLADDDSLELIPEFIAANYVDYIYAPLCATLGIIGNVLAFWVLVRARYKSSTYVYMASLSVSDTIVQIVNILFLVRKFPGHETMTHGTCGLVFFLLYFSIHYNVVVMVTMTVERWVAITFPLRAALWFSVKRARVVVIVEAVLVIGLDMQHLFLRGMVYDEIAGGYFCVPRGDRTTFYLFKVWPWVDAFIYCYAPLACLVVFNILIVRQVRLSRNFQSTSNPAVASGTSTSQVKSPKMTDKEAQLTRMLLLVTTAFLVFVSPMAVIIVVERYHWIPDTARGKAQYHLVRTVFNNLDYTNHALNFLLYCLSGQRFRRELRQTFSCVCTGSGGINSTSASGREFRRGVSMTSLPGANSCTELSTENAYM